MLKVENELQNISSYVPRSLSSGL